MFWQTKWGGWLLSGVAVGMCAGIFLANHHKTMQILILSIGFLLLNTLLSYNPVYQKRKIVTQKQPPKKRHHLKNDWKPNFWLTQR